MSSKTIGAIDMWIDHIEKYKGYRMDANDALRSLRAIRGAAERELANSVPQPCCGGATWKCSVCGKDAILLNAPVV